MVFIPLSFDVIAVGDHYNTNFSWQNDNDLGHANSNFKFQSVPKERVTRVLEKLNPTKAPGQDNFPLRFLKDGATVTGEPLAHIINLSLKTSVVPRKMKICKGYSTL